ncbi:ADP-ribosylglycohydrolase family protein [Roseicella aquatilis]|uniref:ADP-ribosylglycohydrolase family protein n=1 Tax=Roseicella aquatilis TaxID=2527868 RepID=A0A4R4D3G6_9PROT|nr:ADP-ribosylglycohydrolase family protein [Roseicella aquatilis]TCZ54239.1 ADP-ribosylglycohydrolase family protein [Roseicella aquatilis]
MTGPQAGSLADRAVGALLGLAVGDAVGTTLEFRPRDSDPPLTDMVGGGPFRMPPGGWTDDTSMALGLADSLVALGRFDGGDIMRRWLRWMEQGAYSHTGTCFDNGHQTATALRRFARDGSLPPPTEAAGNGAIMRLAPVVLFALREAPERRRLIAADLAGRQARLTHNSNAAAATAETMAGLLHDLLHGAGAEALGAVAVERGLVRSGGYVRDTWDAARWAVASTGSFREAVLAAANLGEDADTTAAVAGQIAGALYGCAGIPAGWLERLLWRREIETLGRLLIDVQV